MVIKVLQFVAILLVIFFRGGEAMAKSTNHETAIFAGGCFWCVESAFDDVEGVISTTSGYTGGEISNPSYEQVSAGGTGHVEALKVVFDSNKTDYKKLLQVYWRNIDPLDAGGQFCDRGQQYRTVIFYNNDEQKALAEASKKAAAEKLKQEVATEILPATKFYLAEDYHQDYHQKNPVRYNLYRFACGRDKRLKDIWEE